MFIIKLLSPQHGEAVLITSLKLSQFNEFDNFSFNFSGKLPSRTRQTAQQDNTTRNTLRLSDNTN